jgi:hypothetical protein
VQWNSDCVRRLTQMGERKREHEGGLTTEISTNPISFHYNVLGFSCDLVRKIQVFLTRGDRIVLGEWRLLGVICPGVHLPA